jgi:hypothetical protein
MDTSRQLLEQLIQLYMSDLECLHHWWVIFYAPLYILKWVYIFFPILILLGGFYGIRSRNR